MTRPMRRATASRMASLMQSRKASAEASRMAWAMAWAWKWQLPFPLVPLFPCPLVHPELALRIHLSGRNARGGRMDGGFAAGLDGVR